MRDLIIREIKRLAAENGGAPPGRTAFSKLTGITPAKWTGVYWVRWADALADAGFVPNEWNQRRDSLEIVGHIARLTRHLGRLPTRAEIRMQKQVEPGFPAHSTVANHFRTNDELAAALRSLAQDDQQWSDLSEFVAPQAAVKPKFTPSSDDGLVYLLKSGKHYKIGRSEDIERRFREVKIALPEAVTLIHAIRTDDAPGIEAYWHRRFASKRANGEWFELSAEDVRAFCRRKFQ